MVLLLRGGRVLAPEDVGVKDVLIGIATASTIHASVLFNNCLCAHSGGTKILAIADPDTICTESLSIAVTEVDARDSYIVPV